MKILLLEPAVTDKKNITSFMYPSMGIIALAAFLQQENHQVVLRDLNVEQEPIDAIIKTIKFESPQIVGIGAMSVNLNKALAIARLVKSYSKDIIIVLGGVHPTAEPEQTLQNPNVDFIVRGEGEITMAELVKSLEKKETNFEQIAGIGFKKDGKIIITQPRPLIPDISVLPIPAYALLNIKKYRAPYTSRTPFMIMSRSRGCPFLCTFCGVSKMFGQKYRVQSPERSIQEVDYLVNQLGIKEIGFKDSEFTLNPEIVEKFCNLLIERKYDLTWNCNGRVNHANYQLFNKMKQAGCASITFGVESGNQEILDNMKKQTTIQQIKDAVKISRQVGLKVVNNFMIGNPGDTKETIERTIKFAKELNPDYAYFGYTTPFPGTELREQAIKNNWLIDQRMEAVKYEDCIMNATSLPTPELKTYLNKAYRAFYLRPSFIAKRLVKLTPNEIYNSARGAFSIIKDAIRPKA